MNSKVKVEILMIYPSVIVYGYQRKYFEYITCKKALLCCHEKNRWLLVKKNIGLRVFSVIAIAEETTKKA